ncbi:hypothetical protein [Pannonibacter indicus]|jgi:serine/threonine-protein kinase HipA|uniref:Uncharacterized protein n=1 Tax=Pannonibacter indicus TaxID=466044 RepID=A0A0K6HMH7_9HYPH|nr:hypothetical protein [Pannonibacter indicus]CUA92051.1 hypothetical protein Ga0061067_101251 [Pannonibacter indicus]
MQRLFAGRLFLNSYALEGLEGHKALREAFLAAREMLLAGKAF